MNSIEQAKDALETARYAENRSIVDRKLAEAQATATVALAEQQRIANLIAYFQNPGSIPIAIQEQIRDGLGLL